MGRTGGVVAERGPVKSACTAMILATVLATVGCGTEPADTAACEAVNEGSADLDIEFSTDFGVVSARVVGDTAGEPGSAPVVVQLFGRWDSTTRPPEGNIPIPGTVLVRVALAGAGWGDGTDDVRGPNARAAVAEALRYARGNAVDREGCRVNDRFLVANPEVVVLLGQSNGGNLAAATLADATLDFPQPSALVAWEPPAGAQFVAMEFGASDDVYDPGSCKFSTDVGITCAFREELALAVDGDDACFDLDADGLCGSEDAQPQPPTDPMTGLPAPSPAFAEALVAAGLAPNWDSVEQARAFWADRDASRLASAVVERFPDLPFLLLASEEDHALPNLADHPHVFGLGEALQGAGARWVRLNPAMAYTSLADENEPNLPLTLADPSGWLYAEDEESPLSGVYVHAVSEVTAHETARDW